ncbi:MAG: hypothetical protein ACLTDP_02615 [Terrisporobacter sp.]
MNLLNIYSQDIPQFVEEIINTTEFKRLKNVGMDCGCEYTSFPIFAKEKITLDTTTALVLPLLFGILQRI